MVIGGNLNSYVILGLKPQTEYEVALTAIYKDKAESETVVLSETTVARTTTAATTTTTTAVAKMGVRGLQLSDFTTFSMLASWELLGSNVYQYRISYVSTRGDRAEQA
ncbi:collagen alpha-1(XIV) chain-like isoform X1, partial [Tachysurus ichikawai]